MAAKLENYQNPELKSPEHLNVKFYYKNVVKNIYKTVRPNEFKSANLINLVENKGSTPDLSRNPFQDKDVV